MRLPSRSVAVSLVVLLVFGFLLLLTPSDFFSPERASRTIVAEKVDRDSIPERAVPAVDRPGENAPRMPAEHPVTAPRSAAGLIIPVRGVEPEDLVDTYSASRSAGRSHNAIDIMAAHNTPVLAATDGVVKRLFLSDKGGITIYQLGNDGSTIYYYAHLAAYAEGLDEGDELKQGDVIGYVGDTGNSGKGNFHLHFAVWKIRDPKNFWTGVDLNPYELLR